MSSSTKSRYTYLSLFSGCGGFDEGFRKAGFNCLGAYDIDPVVINVHKKNIGGPAFVYDLLQSSIPNEDKFLNVDVVISGSPCQGFSTIGKRKLNDPRNKLLVIGGEIAVRLRAKVFIAENVMGSNAGKHKIYWKKLEQLLLKNKYNVRMIKCEAIKVGLPQLRKRVILIAWKGKGVNDFIIPSVPMKSLKELLLCDKLSKLANNEVYKVDEITSKIAKHILPGQKLSNVRGGSRSVHTWDIPDVFGKISKKEKEILLKVMSLRRTMRIRKFGDADPVDISLLKKEFQFDITKSIKVLIEKKYLRRIGMDKIDLANTFNGKYKRLDLEKPSPTVDTRFGDPKCFLHPTENRGLTPREAARIQGFSDEFIFFGSKEQQFRMIGNAVPPPMSFEIAKLIKSHILVDG